MMRSLRWQLLLGTIAASGLIFGMLGVCIDRQLRATLCDEFDGVLLEKGRSLASMVEQQGSDIHFDYEQAQFPEFEAAEHPAYFQIVIDGANFRRSASLADKNIAVATDARAGARSLTLPDRLAGRMLAVPFRPYLEADVAPQSPPPPAHSGCVFVAQNTQRLDATLTRLRIFLAALCGGAAVLCSAAMFLVVSRAIQPVRRLAHDIDALPVPDFSGSLDGAGLPSELVPIVDCLNHLFGRLSEAFERERAFTADMAHELRTPLAGLLATLEVCRSRPRDAAAYQSAIDKCLLMLTHMQHLVERLLVLARAESGQLAVRCTPVDPAPLLHECWLSYQAAAHARGIACAIDTQAPATVRADAGFLRMIFDNLFDNAASYAPEGSRIEVRTSRADRHLIIEIANTVRGLTPSDLPHLGRRFWRKDHSRSTTGSHAGLGLSLCQRLAALQGISLGLRIKAGLFIASLEFVEARMESTDLNVAQSSLPV